VATRVGFQTPFTNITLDLNVPERFRNQPVLNGHAMQGATYGDFQRELDLFNQAFLEVMIEGDAKGRVFTFPIPINLEATPTVGASYRLAKLDCERHPTMRAFEKLGTSDAVYSNSSLPPVEAFDDPFALLDQQDEFQIKYTGGTVLHFFLGERIDDPATVKRFVRAVCAHYRLPYFTLTPTFSICPDHGYLAGEHPRCPRCGVETEVYSRVVGYLRPVRQWNRGKQIEFARRALFDGKLP
jgi:anaerobic ribonucleoside-triphosphate reductase